MTSEAVEDVRRLDKLATVPDSCSETERRLQRRDHGSNARETTVEIDRRVRIAFGVLLILFLGFTVVSLVLAVRIRFADFSGVLFLGRSHRRVSPRNP